MSAMYNMNLDKIFYLPDLRDLIRELSIFAISSPSNLSSDNLLSLIQANRRMRINKLTVSKSDPRAMYR